MEQTDAINYLMQKSEQQLKMMAVLTTQLEQSNLEKQQLRLEVTNLKNENIVLRREKENYQYQYEKEKEQTEQLQKILYNSNQQQQNAIVINDQQQNQSFLQQSKDVIENEYKKQLRENQEMKLFISGLQDSITINKIQIEQYKYENEKLIQQINHLETIISKKENHILDQEKMFSNYQELQEQKFTKLQQQLLQTKAQLFENTPLDTNEELTQQKLQNHQLQIKCDELEQQYQELYNLYEQQQNYLQQPISVERPVTEQQSSSDRNPQMKVSNNQQGKNQSEQKSFVLKTVSSQFTN